MGREQLKEKKSAQYHQEQYENAFSESLASGATFQQ